MGFMTSMLTGVPSCWFAVSVDVTRAGVVVLEEPCVSWDGTGHCLLLSVHVCEAFLLLGTRTVFKAVQLGMQISDLLPTSQWKICALSNR